MNRKRDRLSGRAAMFTGDRRFPRVVPETGLLRVLGWTGKPARPGPDATNAASRKRETERPAAAAK